MLSPFLPAPACTAGHRAGSGSGGQGDGLSKYPKMSTAIRLFDGRLSWIPITDGETGIPLYCVPGRGTRCRAGLEEMV